MDAVHPRADEHLVPFVEEDRHVVRVDAVDGEREHARAVSGVLGTEDVDPGLVQEGVGHAGIDGVLLRLDLVEPDARKIIDAGMRPDHARVVLEAGLEPVGRGTQGVGL